MILDNNNSFYGNEALCCSMIGLDNKFCGLISPEPVTHKYLIVFENERSEVLLSLSTSDASLLRFAENIQSLHPQCMNYLPSESFCGSTTSRARFLRRGMTSLAHSHRKEKGERAKKMKLRAENERVQLERRTR